MKKTLQPVAASVRVGFTIASLFVVALLTGRGAEQVHARFGPRDRGALTLEQAIVTAVLSVAAIALGVVIVGAIATHQSNIK